MNFLQNQFNSREDLITHVKTLAPWAEGEHSYIQGTRQKAERKLKAIDPINYGSTRNFANGNITHLSPYIHHGILSLNEVRNYALTKCAKPVQIVKFIQELAWRDFWQRILYTHQEWAWEDIEPYKTGFSSDQYSDILPEDIAKGETGVTCIDTFIHELIATGYLHNHARMYLASYLVHFRRIKWQVGAKWFLRHLLDGNIASNNLSWQWIASTYSNKPYIFNLENIAKYFGKQVDAKPHHNQTLNADYETLQLRLFPNLGKKE